MITDYKSLLKEKPFMLLWTSQILSQVTINMLNFIILVNLFVETGSTIATSFLWIAYALPAILFGPIASAFVDVYSRKKLLTMTNLLQALLILTFSFSNQSSVYLYFAIAFLYSLINQFYVPSEAASLPALVKKENLAQANGLFFLTQQSALVIGFGLAGPINSLLGFRYSLILSALLMFCAFVAVSFIKGIAAPRKPFSVFAGNLTSFFTKIYDGYTFIRDNRKILLPFLLLLGVQGGLAVIAVSVPAIAQTILAVDVNLAGLLIVIPAAIGAMLGAALIPSVIRKGARKKRIIKNSLLFLTFALLAMALGLGLATPAKFFISSSLIALVGFSFVGILIPSQTFLQEVTPGGMRGRVFGNFWFIATITSVLPVIFSGTVTELLGIRTLLILFSLLALITYYVAASNKLVININKNV